MLDGLFSLSNKASESLRQSCLAFGFNILDFSPIFQLHTNFEFFTMIRISTNHNPTATESGPGSRIIPIILKRREITTRQQRRH